jgi:Cys/Met metabolism PLP-dependent enzyme
MANSLRHLTGDAAYLAALLGPSQGRLSWSATPTAARSCPTPLLGTSRCSRWCSAMGGCPTRVRASSSSLSLEVPSRAIWCRRRSDRCRSPTPTAARGVDLWLDRELFPEAFAADVDPETAKVMAATQRPWSGAGYAGPSGPPGVAVDPVVVPGGHRGPSHPTGGAALHGRAWERTDRGGGGLARIRGRERVTAAPLGGHSDLLLGIVVAADPALAAALRHGRELAGATPGALEIYLALRGIRTLAVRLDWAQRSAQELARRLAEHPGVTRVRYPGLADHPGHRIAARQMRGVGHCRRRGAMRTFSTPSRPARRAASGRSPSGPPTTRRSPGNRPHPYRAAVLSLDGDPGATHRSFWTRLVVFGVSVLSTLGLYAS